MAKVKGCLRKGCIANSKKTKYKTTDNFCLKCGDNLHNVCKSCYTKLDDDVAKYCVRCLAEKHDRKHKTAAAAGTAGVAGIGVIAGRKQILELGKTVAGLIRKR